MEITETTKLTEILTAYPWLKEELIRKDEQFRILNSPMAKLLLKNATMADAGKRSGVDTRELITMLQELIAAHKEETGKGPR